MTSALDLFSGVGWGVALDRLGIVEHAVDIEPVVGETRRLNGMSPVIYRDVWNGLQHPNIVPHHRILIASPVCQTFSMAGNGAGRDALDLVLAAVADRTWTDYDRLRDLESSTDPRTALVIVPLAYAYRFSPEVVILEQVPPVLPVWKACADALRDLGYSVWTDVVSAEQYGVPQTRKRAILIARRDGVEAVQPPPTHSRYYGPRDPWRSDPAVNPWVSMRGAIDRGLNNSPSPTITGGGIASGGAEPIAKFARYTGRSDWLGDDSRLSVDEAATLQSFPPGFRFAGAKGKQFLQIGNAVPPLLAEAIISSALSSTNPVEGSLW